MYSRNLDNVDIDAQLFDRFKDDCNRVALITAVCHDPEFVTSVTTVYTVDDSVIVERLSPKSGLGRDEYESRYQLFEHRAKPTRVVAQLLDREITAQKNSDSEVPFSWHVDVATEDMRDSDTIADFDGTYVGPERLNPPFDVPDDASIATLDVPSPVHQQIVNVNEQHVGLNADIERFRGTTYIIGADEDDCRTLSEACFEQKQRHQEMDFFEDAENADRAESALINPTIKDSLEA